MRISIGGGLQNRPIQAPVDVQVLDAITIQSGRGPERAFRPPVVGAHRGGMRVMGLCGGSAA